MMITQTIVEATAESGIDGVTGQQHLIALRSEGDASDGSSVC